MIPLVAMVSLRGKQSRTFRLWIPLVLVWFLLMPLVLILSPVIFVACLACRIGPFRGTAAAWQVLSALSRTEFEVEHASAGISVYIL